MQDNLLQSLDKLKKLPQDKISSAIILLLLAYIAWLLAQITWQLFPKPDLNILQSNATNTVNSSVVAADTSKITGLNLFGDFNAEPVVVETQPEDAPETTLNLKLTGVVPSSDKLLAAAIIEKSGSQDVYGIDEKIDGTRAVIKEIYADRIILEQTGRRETLMLEGQDYSAIAVSEPIAPAAKVEPETTENAELTEEGKEVIEQIREEALSDPGKLVDYLKASPVKRDGELVGYRLFPGKDPKLFAAVGLEAGDIATEINGYDLTNLSQAMQAMNQLKEAQEASLIVERNGSVKQIYISLY
ncbi:type II secretion system protein GspC [Catenovulum sp. 2E275]|uniref:type II secretion system protein GspC n=1 Tax=Catenovulum sp. 2E275 TaxID=2980497 RepID=UPI0021D18B13|nr:type II secretion system protein GspC [Catenovulum sp. 2E275]MCU4674395.1 type II secretion system protein GspC [Catenovulum sp. 2E275]